MNLIHSVESFKFVGAKFSWTVGLNLIHGDVISWKRRFSVLARKLFQNICFRREYKFVRESYPRIPRHLSHREFK